MAPRPHPARRHRVMAERLVHDALLQITHVGPDDGEIRACACVPVDQDADALG